MIKAYCDQKEIKLENEFVTFAKDAHSLYLFGSGSRGRFVYLLLKEVYAVEINGFISSIPCDTLFFNKIVYPVSVIDQFEADTRIIICMSMENLKSTGKKEIIEADERYFILNEYFYNWLKLKYRDFYTKPYTMYTSVDKQFTWYDWTIVPSNDCEWLGQFIRFHFPDYAGKINLFTVYGKNKYVKCNHDNNKVFFSGECLADTPECERNPRLSSFDHCLEDVQISLGFEYIDHPVYLRFPLWLIVLAEPAWGYRDIKKRIDYLNEPVAISDKEKDCVCVCSHDRYGTRRSVCDEIAKITNIQYAGKWRNNTSELWEQYNNDKHAYIQKFKFNICPENMNSAGYCTEKVMDAILAGCIPVYYGSDNNPEPEVFRKEAIILFDPKIAGNTSKAADKIDELLKNKVLYNDFMSQKRFTDSAADWIYERMCLLRDKIEQMIS